MEEPKPTRLAEMIAEASALETRIIESGGEIPAELEAMIASVDLGIASKVDGVKFVLERMDLSAAYWANRADESRKVADALDKSTKRLKDYVKALMIESGRTELLGIDYRFKLAKAKPRLVLDESKLAPLFMTTETVTYPNKEQIRETLNMGIRVEGATLENSHSLRAYPNKNQKG